MMDDDHDRAAEAAVLRAFSDWGRTRVHRDKLVRRAAQTTQLTPQSIDAALQRLLRRRVLVADVSHRILRPPGEPGGDPVAPGEPPFRS